MKSILLVIVVGLAAGSGGVAFADGSAAGPAGPPASPDAGAGGLGTSTMAPSDWLVLDSRPLTVPMGKLAVDVVVPFFASPTATVTDGMPTTSTTFSVGALVAGTYGVSDKLEVGGSYGFSLDSFDLTPTLTGRAAYFAYHQDKLDVAVAAALSVNTNSSGDADLLFGAWVRYRLAPKLALFTGQPTMIPQIGGGITAFFYGPDAYQLDFTLNNGAPINLTLPVGVSYQLTPNIYGYFQLVLADLALNKGTDLYLFSDFIPVTLGAFYSMDKLDLGLSFGDDLKNAGDYYAFTVNARYWVK